MTNPLTQVFLLDSDVGEDEVFAQEAYIADGVTVSVIEGTDTGSPEVEFATINSEIQLYEP